jgi:hypothetical protein
VVSLAGTEVFGGETYWRTRNGEYVAARFVDRYLGSAFEGVQLGPQTGLTLPLAFAVSHKNRGLDAVVVRAAPGGAGGPLRKLARREPVAVLGYSDDGAFVRIAEAEWVARADLRIAALSGPPTSDVLDERWLDVDLENQVAVLYDGVVPVYATLVSTGNAKHRTPTGVFRVNRKKARTTMRSEPGAEEAYMVENVPWTLYFYEGFAVHGAFWHDGFGRVRSHGCVNMAPADAHYVYAQLGPEIPPGWNEVVAGESAQGALIRVRSRRDPLPAFRGVAATLEREYRAAAREPVVATR